jgi:prevent-host-death family protein
MDTHGPNPDHHRISSAPSRGRPTFTEDEPIQEVRIGDLNRQTSAVMRTVDRGDRVIVTKHGRPIAAILPIEEALEVFVGTAERFVRHW